jgi:hypothetical protein
MASLKTPKKLFDALVNGLLIFLILIGVLVVTSTFFIGLLFLKLPMILMKVFLLVLIASGAYGLYVYRHRMNSSKQSEIHTARGGCQMISKPIKEPLKIRMIKRPGRRNSRKFIS